MFNCPIGGYDEQQPAQDLYGSTGEDALKLSGDRQSS
jgi:hypothetical protein